MIPDSIQALQPGDWMKIYWKASDEERWVQILDLVGSKKNRVAFLVWTGSQDFPTATSRLYFRDYGMRWTAERSWKQKRLHKQKHLENALRRLDRRITEIVRKQVEKERKYEKIN